MKFRDTLSDALKLVFLLTIPSACGLIVLGEPIISLIYEGGRFRSFDTNMTAWALAAYSIGLAGYAAIKILSPSFYALDDAKTPMWISVVSIAVHAPMSIGMMTLLSGVGVSPERPDGFGHVGVALATSTVALVNFAALTYFMRRRIKRLNGRDIAASLAKIGVATAAMSAVAWAAYQYLSGQFVEKVFTVRLIEAFVPIGLAGVTFLIAAKILKIGELEKIYSTISKRLGRG